MTRRLGISALCTVLFLGPSGFQVAHAVTIQNILDGGGSTTVGQLQFTFANDSVGGAHQNGPYTAADIIVDAVSGGLKFTPSPMLDLKTQQGNTSLEFTITYTVMSTGGGIERATLSFTPGLVENGGTSEVTKSFMGRAESLHVFRSNNNEVITQDLTQSVSFPDLPTSLMVRDVGRVSLAVAQGNQRTIQLIDLTNTFAVPEPPTLVLTCSAISLGIGCWWRRSSRAAA
jgi:hypothetical protein